MTSRAHAFLVAMIATGFGLLLLPALGPASSGGSGLTVSGSRSVVRYTGGTVTASRGGIVLVTRASAFLRSELRFSGRVPASDRGAVVQIERLGHQTGWTWAPTIHTRAARNGSFSAVWDVNHIGRFAIRAVIQGGRGGFAAAASPTVTVTVYRPAIATIFGPGFYGQETACGEILGRRTLGVANRTLPCGTQVAIYFRGRTIVVPVIDRGPYANHADWDLTEATAQQLGMDGTETIGAVSLPRRP